MFDSDLVRRRRARAERAAEPGADFLARAAADDLDERLGTISRTFGNVAIAGGRGVDLAAIIRRHGHGGSCIDRLPGGVSDAFSGVGEAQCDLLVSFLDLHDVGDPVAYLGIARQVLRPDGLFLACFVGGESLGGLREALLTAETELTGGAHPRVHPTIALRDAGALLQRAGFRLPVVDREPRTVRYDTMFGLMADLRAMGATSSLTERSRRPATRALFARAAEIYAEREGDADGRVRAMFEIVWLSGWSPHDSQQKPLARGSAKTSLAAALRDVDPGSETTGQ